ncbi:MULTISPECIES: cellulose biosynthesis cyclic di-GMP-binding regulatory protein BcsB [Photobacterium]|uniref:Cyclic di-GMP-binding protein n=1 Tax=Photobacterium ganghwense TaxID=320778 RepID=A0A0J1K2B7_9GAMM|nr:MULTISPECIES: cellulose biosynthesis cyclic di-GMP-binding regulatory protein BcsB [Photobacterium]KLV08567.1 cellulose synthase [Photobacterium ganghwense]MBV1839108.1 cellulose biosynthesis cyclic di-GMP-binding regulatory protein BcsB [Photobacterium ganghwense]PSU10679.1 cellulose biosynthesis cyclic di-GMP-binding regulatory protein BcsB [Photobacterium ganghwense]QSV12822.1 cellulose biosynthesis cyclic di-GMP-binding regulatory protein BcsB [Photobacterium ganghwense]
MKINKKITALTAALSLACLAGDAAAVEVSQLSSVSNDQSQTPDASLVIKKVMPFNQLGFNRSIAMLGSEANAYIGFGSRLDEVVSKANLYFDVTPSPALLSLVSHIKVYLNNELMGVTSIEDGQQGKKLSLSMPLDTRFFSNFNQIRFELIGNTKKECSNPNDSSIWAEISQSSRIEMYVQKTELESDLSLLPAPFFDVRDFSPLNLPIIMGDNYSLSEIKAAGVLSSYFGSLAGWRGAHFPLSFDSVPEHNAVVFVSNDNKPAFLRDFPDADGPRLQIISHPTNPYVKLLLVIGRDSNDLNTAVQGLALGNQLLTGPMAKINEVKQIKPRVPYDAPNWVSTSRPVALSELVEQKSMLQVEGRTPPPINVSLRLPPDLFTWQSRGIPMDLSYRYSPPTKDNSGSRLTLSINDQFVEAFNLTTSGQGGDSNRVRVPLLDDSFLSTNDLVRIPAFKVGSENQIEFEFGFASVTDGQCLVTQPSKQYAVIDGDSTIDFSGFPHYIEMPNMRAFATSGFPYTRMADLSETVVVIPQNASREALQTFMNVMGSLGGDSGYPGIKVTLTDQWDKAALKNKDILSIGVVPELKDAAQNADQVNLVLQAGKRQILLPGKNEQQLGLNWMNPSNSKQDAADFVSVEASGSFAAITGMESPFTPNRTLVSIMASKPADFAAVDQAITDSGKVAHMFGSVVTLRNGEVASYNVGSHYYMGKLPVWQLVWYHFSNHPVIVAFFAALLVVIVTIVLWRVLRQIAQKRTENTEDEE